MDLTQLSDAELLALRNSTKQKVAEYHGKSLAIKILLNGGYGALSNQYNRWYSDDLAESITLSGQLSVNWVERDLNLFMNKVLRTQNEDYVIAIDTDSCYLKVDDIVKKAFGDTDIETEERYIFLMNLAKQIEKVIADSLENLYATLNAKDKSLHMKLEAIGSAVWVAKKRYAMNMVAFKGVRHDPPKLKVMGIDAVRSSTPQICREAIKKALPMIIRGQQQEVKAFINETQEKFSTLPFHQVAFPRGTNEMDKWTNEHTIYNMRTPIHVRGSLLYNHLVKQKKLTNQLPLIKAGDKIRYCYMRLPNPIKEDVFACPDELPTEFELEEYIDYPKQFDKSFLDPLKHVINAAGIQITNDVDISQFFVVQE